MMVALDVSAKDVQIIALTELVEGLEGRIDKHDRQISDLQRAFSSKIEEITKDIIDIREYFPKLVSEDRKRLVALEHPEKTPGQISQDRAKKIDKYMEGRPDHKASYEALKGFLVINDVLLNFSIASLKNDYPDKYITIKDKKDHRKRWLLEVQKIL
jgi:hypothetical protein